MPIVATGHERHAGKVIDTGHCVRFLQTAAQVPITSQWRRGAPVLGSSLAHARGTCIATFNSAGRYANAVDGSSHAAILSRVMENGIWVWDQWQGQPVHERFINSRKGKGDAANDADQFYVIEVDGASQTV